MGYSMLGRVIWQRTLGVYTVSLITAFSCLLCKAELRYGWYSTYMTVYPIVTFSPKMRPAPSDTSTRQT